MHSAAYFVVRCLSLPLTVTWGIIVCVCVCVETTELIVKKLALDCSLETQTWNIFRGSLHRGR